MKPVPGTLKVHGVTVIGIGEHKVLVRNVSCYCEKCFINPNHYDVILFLHVSPVGNLVFLA